MPTSSESGIDSTSGVLTPSRPAAHLRASPPLFRASGPARRGSIVRMLNAWAAHGGPNRIFLARRRPISRDEVAWRAQPPVSKSWRKKKSRDAVVNAREGCDGRPRRPAAARLLDLGLAEPPLLRALRARVRRDQERGARRLAAVQRRGGRVGGDWHEWCAVAGRAGSARQRIARTALGLLESPSEPNVLAAALRNRVSSPTRETTRRLLLAVAPASPMTPLRGRKMAAAELRAHGDSATRRRARGGARVRALARSARAVRTNSAHGCCWLGDRGAGASSSTRGALAICASRPACAAAAVAPRARPSSRARAAQRGWARRVIEPESARGRAFKTWADAGVDSPGRGSSSRGWWRGCPGASPMGRLRLARHGVNERRRLRLLTTRVRRMANRDKGEALRLGEQGGRRRRFARLEAKAASHRRAFRAGRAQDVGDDARDGEAAAVSDDEGDGSVRPSGHGARV